MLSRHQKRSAGETADWDPRQESDRYLWLRLIGSGERIHGDISKANIPEPAHYAAYWAKRTAGFDFSKEDAVDPKIFDQIIWAGLHRQTPYPNRRSGLDLRNNRYELLRKVAAGGGSLARE